MLSKDIIHSDDQIPWTCGVILSSDNNFFWSEYQRKLVGCETYFSTRRANSSLSAFAALGHGNPSVFTTTFIQVHKRSKQCLFSAKNTSAMESITTRGHSPPIAWKGRTFFCQRWTLATKQTTPDNIGQRNAHIPWFSLLTREVLRPNQNQLTLISLSTKTFPLETTTSFTAGFFSPKLMSSLWKMTNVSSIHCSTKQSWCLCEEKISNRHSKDKRKPTRKAQAALTVGLSGIPRDMTPAWNNPTMLHPSDIKTYWFFFATWKTLGIVCCLQRK